MPRAVRVLGRMADNHVWVSAFMLHPFWRKEVIRAFWKEERQPGAWWAGASTHPKFIPVTTVGLDGAAPTASAAAAQAASRRGTRGWRSSSSEDEYYGNKRVPAPWISSSSPPPPPLGRSCACDPNCQLATWIPSPPASDFAPAIALCGCAWTMPSRACTM